MLNAAYSDSSAVADEVLYIIIWYVVIMEPILQHKLENT